MSEQGWRDFLAADGVEDWVGLHGGAAAVFRTGDMHDAARLAEAIAAAPGFEGSGALLTIRDAALNVRLTRDMWWLEPRHVELARAISKVARERGAEPDRSAVNEVQLAISSRPDEINLEFWRAVLGYEPMSDDNAVDPLGHGTTVWMQELDPQKPLRHAMHIDVSLAREHLQARLDAALAAGGRVVDDSEAPQNWVLADPAGNRLDLTAWPDGAPPPAEDAPVPNP